MPLFSTKISEKTFHSQIDRRTLIAIYKAIILLIHNKSLSVIAKLFFPVQTFSLASDL